jgi:hypothetical protein
MKTIKMLFMGILLGLIVGLWLGVNIGKGNPIFSNPFAKENLQKKIKVRVGESIEQLGEDIKGKVNK